MDIDQAEKTRKRRFAYLCAASTIPIVVGFTIVDIVEGDTLEALLNVLTETILFACILGIQRLNVDLLVYRLGLFFLCADLFCIIVIGSGGGTAIYWLSPFPMVFFLFLGKREGAAASAAFTIFLCIILFNPFSLQFYSYSPQVCFRFLASLLLVLLIAYGLEAFREKFRNLFSQNQASLGQEKRQLEEAAKEIKHLSGLLPICSQCKKIRDDAGYWQQVEVYVRDHSEANFSYSICPDCIQLLYPEKKWLWNCERFRFQLTYFRRGFS